MKDVIKRGDIWVVDLNPGFGREMHKKRPALIISTNTIPHGTNHVIIIPASSQVPALIGSEMMLIEKEEGLDKPSVLLPVFIRSIDKLRLVKKIGSLPKTKMQEIEYILKLILDIA